ncbi:MAG: DUF3552 domain-containing protein, partial [Candidatus Aminicenantes bacterium]|nr:DUF3552 domain-containing protein [Candidatus Aminicenantes bacterium]
MSFKEVPTVNTVIIGTIGGLLLCAVLILLVLQVRKGSARRMIFQANKEAQAVRQGALDEAERIKREAVIEAKEKEIKLKAELEAQMHERRNKINELERRLVNKEENLERKTQGLERKEHDLQAKERRVYQREKELDLLEEKKNLLIQKETEELERISGLSQEDAKSMLIKKIEDEARLEAVHVMRRVEEETREKSQMVAREIISQAIQRSAADHVVETTVSVVDLPSEDMKGRIIGREGRNIRALEQATGVDIIVDDTPEAVILSSFDPVRRELARLSIEKLVSDGRIHPARIEDIVENVKADLEEKIKQEGESAAFELRAQNIHP